MYTFILQMWKIGKVDAAKVQSYVGKYITQAQAQTILETSKG